MGNSITCSYRAKAVSGFITALIWLLVVNGAASADEDKLIQWQSTDVQFLRGSGFELGNSDRTIMTLQHAHGWAYGDNYFFYDKTFNGQDYFEWHPRLSLSKITKTKLATGPIKDVFLSGTLEVPENGSKRYLAGVGLNWDIPGFNYVKTNFHIRDNPDLEGKTWGTTFAWKKKFKIGAQPFLFDGFIDMAGSEGNRSSYQLIVPTFLADIGKYTWKEDQLFFGTEYQYWHNKFGLRGVNESVLQVEIRWVIT